MAADFVQNGDVTVFFNEMKGMPQLPRQTYKDITEEGVNGIALLKTGKRGIPFTIVGMTNAATAIAIAGVHTTVKNMVDTICKIQRENLQYENNLCVDVRCADAKQAVAVQGGVVDGGRWLLWVEMDFIYVGSV